MLLSEEIEVDQFYLNDLSYIYIYIYLQSGAEASIVAEIVEVEENSTQKMQTLRIPPVLTVNKSAAYAIYELTYIRVSLLSYLTPKYNCNNYIKNSHFIMDNHFLVSEKKS